MFTVNDLKRIWYSLNDGEINGPESPRLVEQFLTQLNAVAPVAPVGPGTVEGNNSFFGTNSGGVTTGGSNSFFGSESGAANTTGEYNSFFGSNAGQSNTTGYYNSFFGANAGQSNTTGYSNSFFGYYAGQSNSTGSYNAFFGVYSGNSNTTGYGNSFFGYAAGQTNTTGNYNTFVGRESGSLHETGSQNVFIGWRSGGFSVAGNRNIAIGADIHLPGGGDGQLTIGNLIYGTGLDGTGGAVSTGNIGIGVPTPLAKLHIVSGGAVRFGNAAVAGAVVPTHTFTIQDSTGTTYRVPCLI